MGSTLISGFNDTVPQNVESQQTTVTADIFPGNEGKEIVFVSRESGRDSVYLAVPVFENHQFKEYRNIQLGTSPFANIESLKVEYVDNDDKLDITYSVHPQCLNCSVPEPADSSIFSFTFFANQFEKDAANALGISLNKLYFTPEQTQHCESKDYLGAYPEEFPECINEIPSSPSDTRASDVEWRVQRLESEIRRMQMDERFQDMDIDALERRIKALEDAAKKEPTPAFPEIDDTCSTSRDDLEELESRVDDIESRLDDLESRIDDLEN